MFGEGASMRLAPVKILLTASGRVADLPCMLYRDSGAVIRILWDDLPPLLGILDGGGQPENAPPTHLTKFRIFPTD